MGEIKYQEPFCHIGSGTQTEPDKSGIFFIFRNEKNRAAQKRGGKNFVPDGPDDFYHKVFRGICCCSGWLWSHLRRDQTYIFGAGVGERKESKRFAFTGMKIARDYLAI